VQFTTFAYYRIRGAVFDHVRRAAESDPRVCLRVNTAEAIDTLVEQSAQAQLENEGTVPAEQTLHGVLAVAATAYTVAHCAEALLSQETLASGDSAAQLERMQQTRAVRDAVQALPEKERLLLTAMYFEHATLEEAGARVGLSKSWASRLHARALGALREHFHE